MSGSDEQLVVLQGIWSEMKSLNGRIDRTREELRDEIARVRVDLRDEIAEVRAEIADTSAILRAELSARIEEVSSRLDETRLEVRSGFEMLGKRIDNVYFGEHGQEHAELRQRIERLEQHLGIRPAP